MSFEELSYDERIQLKKELFTKLEVIKAKKLDLTMARGNPCTEQLDLSKGLINGDLDFSVGTDFRNYGVLGGIPEIRRFFAEVFEVDFDEVMVHGNSSLTFMYDTILRSMLFGTLDSDKPWSQEEKVTFLCPVPGYDRHFSICELLGIDMIPVPMDEHGPDVEIVKTLVAKDSSIKGMWCVPKYSNPSGVTYSDEVVKTLASMETAAPDFKLFWDNAYIVHHLSEVPDQLLNIMEQCKAFGHPNRVYMYTSTSKVTFAGAGVAAFASSAENIEHAKKLMSYQSIGPNKLDQWMHVNFLKDVPGLKAHMAKHAAIIRPKFDLVLNKFEAELGHQGVASWSNPNGGYFISVDLEQGCAKDVVNLCKEYGVTLTEAGATYPYKQDPKDSNIRIAPTLPPLEELSLAMDILCLCIKYVSLTKHV